MAEITEYLTSVLLILKTIFIICPLDMLQISGAVYLGEKNLCLNWKVTEETLTLNCQILNFYHLVSIKSPEGKIVGDCFFQPTISCESFVTAGKMSYNKEKKAVVFVYEYNVGDEVFLGKWSCLHGQGQDAVAITVWLPPKERQQNATNETLNQEQTFHCSCVQQVMLLTTSSALGSLLFFGFVCSLFKRNPHCIDGMFFNVFNLKKVYFISQPCVKLNLNASREHTPILHVTGKYYYTGIEVSHHCTSYLYMYQMNYQNNNINDYDIMP